MKTIYLSFCSDADLISKLIAMITGRVGPEKYPIIHCEIVLKEQDGVYTKYCARPFHSTYKMDIDSLSIYEELYDYAELYRFEVTDLEYEALKGFLENQLGKKYDWMAILSLGLFKRDWQSKTKWFCSELLATALNQCTSISLLNKRADAFRVTPRDLYLSPIMTDENHEGTFYRS